MKIALIRSGNIKLSPYIGIFKKVLAELNADYDLISWDRESLDEQEGIVFRRPASKTRSRFSKMLDYYRFAGFVRKTVVQNRYDKLIVLGAASGVFMYGFLKKYYAGKIWFDYRDLTIEQRFPKRFKKFLDICSGISISSPGFKKAFPGSYDFIISHNFDIDEVRQALSSGESKLPTEKNGFRPLVVSTIGSIRDYPANLEVILGLSESQDIRMRFIGQGPSSGPLQRYVSEHKIRNVEFQGFYQKEDEHHFYEQTDFVNIYYPRIPSHETALSNRFYKALIFRKPMIVTNRSVQGDYVQEFGLGLALENCSGLASRLKTFVSEFDEKSFGKRCDDLLTQFVADYDHFHIRFSEFVKDE